MIFLRRSTSLFDMIKKLIAVNSNTCKDRNCDYLEIVNARSTIFNFVTLQRTNAEV